MGVFQLEAGIGEQRNFMSGREVEFGREIAKIPGTEIVTFELGRGFVPGGRLNLLFLVADFGLKRFEIAAGGERLVFSADNFDARFQIIRQSAGRP